MDDKPDMELIARDTGNISHRAAGGVALLWSTNMLMRVMQLVTTAILARLLTPADYGLIALATTIIGFIDLVSNLQTGGALIRAQNVTKEHLGSAFTVNLIRGCVTALVMVLMAQPLASYMQEPRLSGVLYALVPMAIMGSLHNPYFILFARNMDYRREAKRNALATIGGSLAGVATAIMFPSYWALIVSSLCTSFIALVLSYWRVPGLPRLSLSRGREFFSYGSWLILINIMEYINSKVDYLLIGKGLGNRVLGNYHFGGQITSMATGDIVAPMSQVLMPAFSIVSTDAARLKAAYRRLQSLTLALALPIGFGVSILASDIILFLVGKQWELAIPVIRILAPLGALHTMIASIESLALATNNGKKLVLRTSIFLCVRTTLMFTGFYMGGFLGIIYARLVSGSFFLIYGLLLAARITQSKWYDPIVLSWRSLLSVILMWLTLTGLTSFFSLQVLPEQPALIQLALLVAKVATGGVIYIGVHLLLWKWAGRPDGAEQKLLELGRHISNKIILKRRK